MLESKHTHLRTMTLSRTGTEYLTKEEWMELNALREAINYDPSTVAPEKMEKFSELLVRSLLGKGDPVSTNPIPVNY